MSSIRDRRLPASVLPGLDAQALTASGRGCRELEQAAAAMEAAVVPLLPPQPDPQAVLADRAVALLEDDRALTRVSELAHRLRSAPAPSSACSPTTSASARRG